VHKDSSRGIPEVGLLEMFNANEMMLCLDLHVLMGIHYDTSLATCLTVKAYLGKEKSIESDHK